MEEVLTSRQRRLFPFYVSKKVPLFGPRDYTLLAPSPGSIILSDENETVASVLFGNTFDLKLRSFVILSWFPGLIFQLVSFPIGLLILIDKLPPLMALLTVPGLLFPSLLLLRSHWRVFATLAVRWESIFLVLYSLIFCTCITLLTNLDIRSVFVWTAIFPALMSSTFIDASAVRLDSAFMKGELSITALTVPPSIVSLAYLLSVIAVINTQSTVNIDHETLHVTTAIINSNFNFRNIASSTGLTICLFVMKGLVVFFHDPTLCVSLDAAMSIDIVTLNKTIKCPDEEVNATPNSLRKIYKSKFPTKLKMNSIGVETLSPRDPPTKLDIKGCIINDDKPPGRSEVKAEDVKVDADECFVLEASFILKGAIGLIPIRNTVTHQPSAPSHPQGLIEDVGKSAAPNSLRLSRPDGTACVSSPTSSTNRLNDRSFAPNLQSDGLHISRTTVTMSQRPRSSSGRCAPLSSASPRSSVGPPGNQWSSGASHNEGQAPSSSSSPQGRTVPPITIFADARDCGLAHSSNTHEKHGTETNNRLEDCRPQVGAEPISEETGSWHLNMTTPPRKTCSTRTVRVSALDLGVPNMSTGCEHEIPPHRSGPSTSTDAPTGLDGSGDRSALDGSAGKNLMHDFESTTISTPIPLSGRQERLAPFYLHVNTGIFGPDEYTLLSPVCASILISDESETVALLLFGEAFDLRLRTFVKYFWYPALLFQLGCLPIGLLILLGGLPIKGAYFTIPGAIFPILMILQCHHKIFIRLCHNWEQIFLTLYSAIFCLSIALITRGPVRSLYVWLVIFPSLVSSAFSDASSTRLDNAFLHEGQRKSMVRNVFLYALPPYVASLSYIFSIVVILNSKFNIIFDTISTLKITSNMINANMSYSITASSTGLTISLFLLKCLYLLATEPDKCVSLRSPMTVNIALLEPPPTNATERDAGHHVLEAKFLLQSGGVVVAGDAESHTTEKSRGELVTENFRRKHIFFRRRASIINQQLPIQDIEQGITCPTSNSDRMLI